VPRTRVSLFAAAGLVTCSAALLLTGCKVRTPGRFETAFMDGGEASPDRGAAPTPIRLRPLRKTFTLASRTSPPAWSAMDSTARILASPLPTRWPRRYPLNSAPLQAYTDGQLHSIIRNGIFPSGMPASKEVFSDEEIWQLVLYIRHLPPKGSLGEPQVYGGSPPPPTPPGH
jgi:hypothetical protein